MRLINDLHLRRTSFCFDGMPNHPVPVTQLVAGPIVLSNSIEHADWSPRRAGQLHGVQLLVCELCGQPGCAAGGFVDLRRTAAFVIITPAWSMHEAIDPHGGHGPPAYLDTEVLAIPVDRWNGSAELRTYADVASMKPLTRRSVARILQWEATAEVLGARTAPVELDRAMPLAASEGDTAAMMDVLDALLEPAHADAPIELVAADESAVPITFHLDAPGYPEWTPLARVGDAFHLRIDPGYLVIPTSEKEH